MKGPIFNPSQIIVVKPDIRQIGIIGKGGVREKRQAVVVEVNSLKLIKRTKNAGPVGVGARYAFPGGKPCPISNTKRVKFC